MSLLYELGAAAEVVHGSAGRGPGRENIDAVHER